MCTDHDSPHASSFVPVVAGEEGRAEVQAVLPRRRRQPASPRRPRGLPPQQRASPARNGGGGKGKGKPRCPHTAPKNRFGIPAGYRWDGVNRTNGFEGRLLRQAKEGEAAAEARYKWSVEDM